MAYCTTTNINNLFGTTNIITWSNLNNDQATADSTRIAAAIAYADSYIDKRFRGGRWALPLTTQAATTPSDITDLAARLAGCWLFESRSMDSVDGQADAQSPGVLNHRRYVDRQIDRYLAGQDGLDAVLAIERAVGPFAVE